MSSPPPLSLITLKYVVFRMSLPFYRPVTLTELSSFYGDLNASSDFTDVRAGLNSKQRLKMKNKKVHEIGKIVDLVNIIIRFSEKKESPINEVVDIGAGLGHLSRVLSLLINKKVKTIEGDGQLVQRAQKIDSIVSGGETEMPARVSAFIKSEDEIDDTKDALLIGVHTCGDLAPTIIRHFKNNKSAKALIHFGCCYHKMNGGLDKLFRDETKETFRPSDKGFPLSEKYKNEEISYAARELACFSYDPFVTKIGENDNQFYVNGSRAALEYLIVVLLGRNSWRHKRMVGVKNGFRMEFWEYAKSTAIHHPEIIKILDEMKQSEEIGKKVQGLLEISRIQVPIFYSLRLLIAPLIETLILHDRVQYLEENGIQTRLISLFDHRISPRNVALVAIK
ncbi:unnamed protein product [Bursaphelenchus xylophilus]|uniref:(pine wood nematode) hypothetical protein n=1 Tax=Bursaphelenchus xylophilus TaxID=6326 RepID=A0A1I7RR60_BURXY|nr:unnamed protein product [Bursaphelenchus xylophilus]CAG9130851.1 unnamed protein product [Bursaphelenchus xylophilus]